MCSLKEDHNLSLICCVLSVDDEMNVVSVFEILLSKMLVSNVFIVLVLSCKYITLAGASVIFSLE